MSLSNFSDAELNQELERRRIERIKQDRLWKEAHKILVDCRRCDGRGGIEEYSWAGEWQGTSVCTSCNGSGMEVAYRRDL